MKIFHRPPFRIEGEIDHRRPIFGLFQSIKTGVAATSNVRILSMVAIVLMGIIVGCQKKSSNVISHGEPLVEKKPAVEQGVDYYTCSMHPQIKADKPGKCPICGMNLIPVMKTGSSNLKSVIPGNEVHLSPEGIQQAGIRTEAVAMRKLTKELLIYGTLNYNLNLHRDIVTLVEGRIERQFIDFNQTEVKKGDSLVALYSQEAIRLQEEYLKILRERWLSTFYERDLLDSAVQLAGERLSRIGFSSGDLEMLRENKKVRPEVVIRAPISGSIVGNMVHIGELAKIDMPLYHIVPLDELWFNAQVFEPDLGLLKLGQKARISTKSFPGEVFVGVLTYIGRALDPINRTIPVRFEVPNKDRRLLPNLSASGNLEIPLPEESLSVPNSSVLDLGTRHVVYLKKENGVYASRNVRIGHITRHYTQILEGLEAGDEIVTSGAFLIDAQAQLRGGSSDEEGGMMKKASEKQSQPLAPFNESPPKHVH
jgi:Cu(I)/Ag(I) efflux system membrane fusion protein